MEACGPSTHPLLPAGAPLSCPLAQVWDRFPKSRGIFDVTDAIGAALPLPRLNYGPGMKLKPVNGSGIGELLAPLNRTALGNKTQLAGALRQVPQAVLTSATLGLNARMEQAASTYNHVVRAWNTGNVSKIASAVAGAKLPGAGLQ